MCQLDGTFTKPNVCGVFRTSCTLKTIIIRLIIELTSYPVRDNRPTDTLWMTIPGELQCKRSVSKMFSFLVSSLFSSNDFDICGV